MTRKDYIVIADAMKETTTYSNWKREVSVRLAHALTCNTLAEHLRKDNPRFNRMIFLTACGVRQDDIEAL